MRKLLTVCGALAVFSTLALAETWNGKLIDATCYSTQQSQPQEQRATKSCDPTTSTTMFALEVSGKVYNFDASGNAKAATALKSRADRSTNPNSPATGSINARVSGEMEGDTIKVESVNLQ